MAYSADRVIVTKLEASPSLLPNNLAAGPRLVFAHKDSVYLLNPYLLDGKALGKLEKLPVPAASSVNQAAWCVFDGKPLLVVAAKASFSLWSIGAVTSATDAGATPRLVFDYPIKQVDGITEENASCSWLCGVAALPVTDQLLVGTSWGDLLVASVNAVGETVKMGAPLKGHKTPVTAIVADDKFVASGDESGSIVQRDATSLEVVKVHVGDGFPVTSLVMRGDVLVAGYADGKVRVYRTGASASTAGTRHLEVEIAAHARSVTGIDMHPHQYTFATVGEDGVVNVWSLPEVATSGRARVLHDMTARLKDSTPTGVAFFARPGSWSKATVPSLLVASYDSHILRIFTSL